MSNAVTHIAQRLLVGVGAAFGCFGLFMLIGLRRSPDGFRPAPFIGLIVLGVVIIAAATWWQRRSTTDAPRATES